MARGKINYGVGYMGLKLMCSSGGRFPFGNYWHQKEYMYMWLDELT